MRPGQFSCALLALPRRICHTRLECLSGARHPSVSILGGTSCVTAAISFWFVCACVYVLVWVCVHVCVPARPCACLHVCFCVSVNS